MKSKRLLTIAASLCFYLLTVIPTVAIEPDLNELITSPGKRQPLRTPAASPSCSAYNELNSRIRDGKISKADAISELPLKLSAIHKEYYRRGGMEYPSSQWVFPVAGYDWTAIGRGRNHGFVPGGYDFFSGNRHGGHPAYDIFIRDRNQDSLDDRSGNADLVLSMTGGIVVALERGWQRGSGLRGGNYLWIYDPANDLLVYYAHNEELFVELGSIVKPGDLLATVGRSGFNAAKKRSPTHLHFSVLSLRNGVPEPEPVYRTLKQARTLPEPESLATIQ